MPSQNRAYGCLLGLILGDALGRAFEGMERESLHRRFTGMEEAFAYASAREELRYTDDGQMALALAEHLTRHDTIKPHQLMRDFCEVYESWRGYGRGARVLIEAFRDDADYEFMAEHLFPGGSLGNGGAMRSAPVGLRFHADPELLWQEAKNSAWPTHRHVLGIEGAQLIAYATMIALRDEAVTLSGISEELLTRCNTTVFQNRLSTLSKMSAVEQLADFGNGIEAHESVVTALGCFATFPEDYVHAISLAIWQGGDTDTIAAMTGALVGARIGAAELPSDLAGKLETGEEFLTELESVSLKLAEASALE